MKSVAIFTDAIDIELKTGPDIYNISSVRLRFE
jgi:hypothetical protein